MREVPAAVFCAVLWGVPSLGLRAEEASGKLFTVKTKNYLVETDISQEYTEEIADLMETIYKCYEAVFRKVPPQFDAVFRVRIFRTQAGYTKVVGRMGQGSGAIFYPIGPKEGMLASYSEGQPFSAMKENLFHEGFHQFLSTRIPSAPIWLNEGLATLFQYSLRKGTKLDARVIPGGRLRFLQKQIKEKNTIPLDELMECSQRRWQSTELKDQFMYYCQAWMLVHFLAYSSKGKYQDALNRYIMLLHGGLPPGKARTQAFGGDTTSLEKAWREYAMSSEPDPMVACKENLGLVAILLMVYQKGLKKKYDDIDEFHADILAEKLKGWDLTVSNGTVVKSADIEKIKAWFKCPGKHSAGEKSDYIFSRQRDPQCDYPDVLCRGHKGTDLRAYWYLDPIDKKIKPDVIDETAGARLTLKMPQ